MSFIGLPLRRLLDYLYVAYWITFMSFLSPVLLHQLIIDFGKPNYINKGKK